MGPEGKRCKLIDNTGACGVVVPGHSIAASGCSFFAAESSKVFEHDCSVHVDAQTSAGIGTSSCTSMAQAVVT